MHPFIIIRRSRRRMVVWGTITSSPKTYFKEWSPRKMHIQLANQIAAVILFRGLGNSVRPEAMYPRDMKNATRHNFGYRPTWLPWRSIRSLLLSLAIQQMVTSTPHFAVYTRSSISLPNRCKSVHFQCWHRSVVNRHYISSVVSSSSRRWLWEGIVPEIQG